MICATDIKINYIHILCKRTHVQAGLRSYDLYEYRNMLGYWQALREDYMLPRNARIYTEAQVIEEVNILRGQSIDACSKEYFVAE